MIVTATLSILMALMQANPLARADDAYAAGRYEQALADYSLAMPETSPRWPVLARMGNCAYRSGRFAEAVWHYRRALNLRPDHRGLRHNLRLAEDRLGIREPPPMTFVETLDRMGDGIPAAWLLVIAPVTTLAGLIVLSFGGGVRRRRAVALLLITLGLLATARLVRDRWFPRPDVAVVLMERVTAREEPRGGADRAFDLVAGEIVTLYEASDRWARVRHVQGEAWIPRAALGASRL